MPSRKKKDDDIKVYLTSDEKKRIERLAGLANKPVSTYVRETALASTLDTAKMEFYHNINENFLEIKKTQFVLTRLLLLLGTEVLKSEDDVINFYQEMAEQAEKAYPKD